MKPLESPGDIIPEILDTSVVDHRVRVSSEDSARMCALMARYGLFAGQSSGAYLKGVYETARRIQEGTIVTHPERYRRAVYEHCALGLFILNGTSIAAVVRTAGLAHLQTVIPIHLARSDLHAGRHRNRMGTNPIETAIAIPA